MYTCASKYANEQEAQRDNKLFLFSVKPALSIRGVIKDKNWAGTGQGTSEQDGGA